MTGIVEQTILHLVNLNSPTVFYLTNRTTSLEFDSFIQEHFPQWVALKQIVRLIKGVRDARQAVGLVHKVDSLTPSRFMFVNEWQEDPLNPNSKGSKNDDDSSIATRLALLFEDENQVLLRIQSFHELQEDRVRRLNGKGKNLKQKVDFYENAKCNKKELLLKNEPEGPIRDGHMEELTTKYDAGKWPDRHFEYRCHQPVIEPFEMELAKLRSQIQLESVVQGIILDRMICYAELPGLSELDRDPWLHTDDFLQWLRLSRGNFGVALTEVAESIVSTRLQDKKLQELWTLAQRGSYQFVSGAL